MMAILLWCILGVQCSLAQPLNQIHPQACKSDHGNAIRCVTAGSRFQSGGGDNYGPWFTLTSTAPKAGYTVKWAEGYISADTPINLNRCGVRGAGTGRPSTLSPDGPRPCKTSEGCCFGSSRRTLKNPSSHIFIYCFYVDTSETAHV
jgi:hypothetical protein